MTSGRAPGKVVLWGEYAVLAGAPAAVLAVNRQVVCEVRSSSTHRFAARGFKAPAVQFERPPTHPPKDRPAALLAWHVLGAVGWERVGPAAFLCDSSAFYHQGRKIGLGSSAALCVAMEGLCAHLAGEAPDFRRAREAHRRFQGGQGSGIDVAAAFFGGALRCQDGRALPLRPALPAWRILWTGEGASTPRQLGRFTAYLDRVGLGALDDLGSRSERLCDAPSVNALREYASALKRLDAAADLGIFTAAHRRAEQCANRYNLAYKPCGAGGGDVGAVFAESPHRLQEFEEAAAAAGLTILNLEIAEHGVEVCF